MITLITQGIRNFSPKDFQMLADTLINKTMIKTTHGNYCIREIEFYLFDNNHRDTHTHCSREQGTWGNWYFHKTGKGYREGTYRGLDITLGDNSGKIFFGILIRTIQNVQTNQIIIGPCCCVNELVGRNIKIKAFTEDKLLSTIKNDRGLCLVDAPTQKCNQLFYNRRYGLSKVSEYTYAKYRVAAGDILHLIKV